MTPDLPCNAHPLGTPLDSSFGAHCQAAGQRGPVRTVHADAGGAWGVWLASPPSTHNPHFPRTCKPKFNSHDITSLWGPQSCGVRWAGLGPCLARGPRPSGKCPGLRWLLRNAWLSRRARGQRKVLTGSTFLTDAAGGPGPSVTSSLVFLLGSSSTWSFACGQVREGTTAKLPGPF